MPDEWFDAGVAFALDALKDLDAQVLAHCHMGINRGLSTAYAILLATGMEPVAALTAIRQARPIAAISYDGDSLDWWHRADGTPASVARCQLREVAQWHRDNRIDPSTSPDIGRQVCIEVYPHPAMVSLFPLDYVIPYKIKRGRGLPALKDAYGQLLDHLEGTCGDVLTLADSARWSTLRTTAAGGTRKSELDAIEDEIDAIFCAYLAWLWGKDQEQMVVLGDYATGYIVTPTPPPPATQHGRPVPRNPAHARVDPATET